MARTLPAKYLRSVQIEAERSSKDQDVAKVVEPKKRSRPKKSAPETVTKESGNDDSSGDAG